MVDLETFEADSAVRRNELLFKINTDMEDTKSALSKLSNCASV